MQMEDSVMTAARVYVQCAVLYTNSQSERRIRVHTLSLPVVGNMYEMFEKSDALACAGVLRPPLCIVFFRRTCVLHACRPCSIHGRACSTLSMQHLQNRPVEETNEVLSHSNQRWYDMVCRRAGQAISGQSS